MEQDPSFHLRDVGTKCIVRSFNSSIISSREEVCDVPQKKVISSHVQRTQKP